LPILSSEDCSGVFFTRKPSTGYASGPYREQIEFGRGFFGNVIADGMVSPEAIENFAAKYPLQYECLRDFKYFDERSQRYPTDIEFAVRSGRIHIVQSRVLRQSPAAQIINSYDFYREGIYSPYKLIKRTAFSLNKKITTTYLDHKAADSVPVIAIGKPVFGGAVSGRVIIDQNTIARFDGPLIFLTESNVPPRVIMEENRFAGYISKEGGVTSHAALIAIGEKKPCVTDIPWERGGGGDTIIMAGMQLREGDLITLDANTGAIYLHEIPIIVARIADERFQNVQQDIIGVIDSLIAASLNGE
jgi:pyruvate,orthophosphate dikinase